MSGTGHKDDPGARVLVVEGGREKSNATDMLLAGGFAVSTAPDGLKAFEEIGENAPGLSLVDCASGEEGIEVCRRLKENMAAREMPMASGAAPGARGRGS